MPVTENWLYLQIVPFIVCIAGICPQRVIYLLILSILYLPYMFTFFSVVIGMCMCYVCMFAWCVYMCGYILSPPPFFLFVERSSYALGHLHIVLKFTVNSCKSIFALRSFPRSALVSREV